MLPISFRKQASTAFLLLAATGLPIHAQPTNAALGKPVTASGPVYDAARAPGMITDGSASSFSHPAAPVAPATALGFKYTINLGSSQALNKLRILNRNDGCCPERLSNYRVSLFADDPAVAGTPAVWTTVLRANGTNSGIGGVDEVLASGHPAGRFAGQWIRLENLSNATYHPQVAEVEALTSANVALYKTVTASAATGAGAPASALTDGISTTYSFPAGAAGATLGFYYQVDFSGDFALDRLVLYSRHDCCPERTTNYRVTLHADNAGNPGDVRWTADVRPDGSFTPAASGEVLRPEQGTGEMRGRFLRITNLNNQASNPQFAEIEAYRATPPTIRFFTTNAGNITKTGAPGLPNQATLSWETQGAASASIAPGNLPVFLPAGNITVTPATATTYTLTASNSAGSVTASVLIAVDAAPLPPRINEFVTDNAAGLEDEDGAKPDWIELFNPNPFTLPLAGAHLSDEAGIPAKWTFPDGVTLPPLGYLTVFASGKDRRVPAAPLHTNFQLQKSGEILSLHAPDGTTLWSRVPADYPATLTYPSQSQDTSYGVNGTGQLRFFRPPTPGAVNDPLGFTTVVEDTSFSVKRGFYTTPQSVAITSATPGATIRYTTNGTRPTESVGTVYTTPITITATAVLRAAAFLNGAAPTNVDTHTYIFPGSVQTQSAMLASITGNATFGPQIPAALTDIPSISLTMASTAAINQDTEVETAVEWLHNTDPLQHTQADAAVTLFGGAYTNFTKKSFRLYFRSEYGDAKLAAPLFAGHEHGLKPMEEFDSLELRNGSHDMVDRGFYMSNLFTDQVLKEMGHLAPHGRMVHLYFNGLYHGMYHLRERWNADMHADYLGGSKDDYEAINGNLNVGGWADPGTVFDGDGTAWEYLKTRRTNYNELRGLLDVQNFVDFMITFMFGNSEDEWRGVSPNRLIGNGSGARFILNDADGWLSINSSNSISAWDGSDNNTARSATFTNGNFNPGRAMGDGPASLFSAMLLTGGVDHRMLVADSIHRHFFNDGVLTPTRNDARLRTMCTATQRPFIAEAARWSNLYRTPASWATARDVCLNSWIPNRTNAVLSQFRTAGFYPTVNAPVFGQNGGVFSAPYNLSLSVPSLPAGAVIHYTLDGSDPRAPGGAVNTTPAPLTYTGPFALTANTIVRARTRTTAGVWSALQEGFFLLSTSSPVPAGAVVPGELHFNPTGNTDAEFIELINVSPAAVNLRGCRFTAGIDFAFSEFRDTLLAPGQRIVLVQSEFIHRQRYSWDRRIAGIYSGSLNNAGEALTLVRGLDPVFSFAFNNAWQLLADGGGRSLTLIKPAPGKNLNAPENWRSSSITDGTPGTGDAGPAFTGVPTADADGDGFSALMEYSLGTSDSLTNPDAGLAASSPPLPGGLPLFSYTRAAAADDTLLVPQIASDLSTWNSGTDWLQPVSEVVLPDGRIRVTLAPGPGFPVGQRAFFRLRTTPRP